MSIDVFTPRVAILCELWCDFLWAIRCTRAPAVLVCDETCGTTEAWLAFQDCFSVGLEAFERV